jgi:DNA-binding response OmpR family regulator
MGVKRKILVVDDDADLCAALSEQIALHEEFEPVAASTAGEALTRLGSDHVDLVLMDVALPDMDGREAVKAARSAGYRGPVIMLTGHDSDDDTIRGFEAGANDYVAKPFRFAVLLARIRAQLRHHENNDDATLAIGPFVFHPATKLLVNDRGSKVRLTEKETAILRYLYRADAKPVGRDELLQEVWGYNAGVTTHTLETHIYRLRQKIEKDPTNASLLVTQDGGYKLVS